MYKRLILGPGNRWPKEPGDVFCDVRAFDRVDVVHNLNVTPWPFADREFDHVSAVHLVEHLLDLVQFMNESWRVLKLGGDLYIETPLAGANPDLEFCDPTHVRCYRIHTFVNYFTRGGVETFGYTDKPWAVYYVGLKPQTTDILVFHGSPIVL